MTNLIVQAADEEIKLLLAGRNELESFLLEMRAAPRRKYGETFLHFDPPSDTLFHSN
jgi:hypothetical protein